MDDARENLTHAGERIDALMEDARHSPPAVVDRPRAKPQRLVAEDPVPLFDTAKFEHMWRIAGALAASSFVPATLRGDGQPNKSDWQPFPRETVQANCFMVVNQAASWNADPFLLIQAVSLVRGRLCWEGKVIAGILDAKLGIELDYEWNDEEGDKAAVTITGFVNGKPKSITGTVREWKTSGQGSPWGRSANTDRKMLIYRGAREWARVFKPRIIVGISTPDEIEWTADLHEGRQTPQEIAAENRERVTQRLAAAGSTGGFDPAHVEREIAGEVVAAEPEKPEAAAQIIDAAVAVVEAMPEPADDEQTRALTPEERAAAVAHAGAAEAAPAAPEPQGDVDDAVEDMLGDDAAAASAGAFKPPPAPATADAYLTHLDMWVPNMSSYAAARARWDAEADLRKSIEIDNPRAIMERFKLHARKLPQGGN